MRALVILLLLAGSAAAAPPPGPAARRKPASDRYPIEALSKFVDAIVADKANDWDEAHRRYEEANKISPQPNTYYNLGDLLRRMERTRDAIESYKKYLELAPGAPDRAEVGRLIAELEKAPAFVTIDGEEPDAIILVDGKLLGPSPQTLRVPAGKHTADRIGPTMYRGTHFEARPGEVQHLILNRFRGEETGNVVIASGPGFTTSGSWDDGGRRWSLPGRLELPPGRYATLPWNDPKRSCNPIAFEVVAGKHLTYVYVDADPPRERYGCRTLRITQQKLRAP
jgi:tetratricopeptide (TPR) repeat protein